MDFLETTVVKQPRPFIPGKTYSGLFSAELSNEVANLVKALALPECWQLLNRYFAESIDLNAVVKER